MPTVTANNCEMFYEIDDFTDPWRTDTETLHMAVFYQHPGRILLEAGANPNARADGETPLFWRGLARRSGSCSQPERTRVHGVCAAVAAPRARYQVLVPAPGACACR